MDDKERQESLNLFRKEALDAKEVLYGSPVRAPGIGMAIGTGFVIALIIAAVVFMVTMSFPRKETVSGALVPSKGLMQITSQRNGVIKEVFVEEGEAIKQGDAIMSVSVDSVIGEGEQIGPTLTKMAGRLAQAALDRESATETSLLTQERSARAQSKRIDLQLQAMAKSYKLYEEQLRIAKDTLDDLDRLRKEKLVSELQYREAEVRVLNIQQSMSDMEVRMSVSRQEKDKHDFEVERILSDRAISHATIASELISAEEKGINYKLATQFNVISNTDGKVSFLQARAGGVAEVGRTLAAILPNDSKLVAEMWVPSTAIAFVEKGTEVRLMYDGLPYQKFGAAKAVVTKIARSPTRPDEVPLDQQAKESHYRITAELGEQEMLAYGKNISLTPGMRFKADLILEKRSLLDLLFDPLIAAKRRHE